MAIGLEIEVAIPIDRLTGADIAYLQGQLPLAVGAIPKYSAAGLNIQQRIQNQGRVQYGNIVAPAGGFRVDADHDDRVQTNSWPPREGGRDSIVEIVMDPPAETLAQFDTAMNNIAAWINTVMANTNNLTTRWVNGLGGGISVGPLTAPPQFPVLPRHPNHNLNGSLQVNVGIDVREYHSMVKWFANSKFAKSSRETDPAAQAIYRQSKADMRQAVDLGRQITAAIHAGLTNPQRQNMGNLRGLRGWITHMALYIKRGTIAGGMGGTPKNLAPVLLKSPPSIAAQYGMTAAEQVYFNNNQAAIVNQILNAVGRGAHAGLALNAVNIFATLPGRTLADLSLASNVVPLTGGPLMNPTGVGPRRTGNATVTALPNVAAGGGNVGGGVNTRGGVVSEFRNLPGYYTGVASWRTVGRSFFNAANERNRRSGIRP